VHDRTLEDLARSVARAAPRRGLVKAFLGAVAGAVAGGVPGGGSGRRVRAAGTHSTARVSPPAFYPWPSEATQAICNSCMETCAETLGLCSAAAAAPLAGCVVPPACPALIAAAASAQAACNIASVGCIATCTFGKCCPTACEVPNPFEPGNGCCDEGEGCVDVDDPNSRRGCCPPDQLVCGGRCCAKEERCCNGECCQGACAPDGSCCAAPSGICGGSCCPPFSSCCDGICCSGSCAGGICCQAPNRHCGDGDICCPRNNLCCGNACCASGDSCDPVTGRCIRICNTNGPIGVREFPCPQEHPGDPACCGYIVERECCPGFGRCCTHQEECCPVPGTGGRRNRCILRGLGGCEH
jgi:hypothetical protein